MIGLFQDIPRFLRRRERMLEVRLDKPPRLGLQGYDYKTGEQPFDPKEWLIPPRVLRDPSRAVLERELEAAAGVANERARVRRVMPLVADPVLTHPCGLMEDTGRGQGQPIPYWPRTSLVGVAWITLGQVKFVRVWGCRPRCEGWADHSYLFLPDSADSEGRRCCWASVFPWRYFKFRERSQERLQSVLERLGPPGEDDRVNLNLRQTLIRAHVPGLGVILSDNRVRTELVQVVVRDPSTGFRHHISIPPRFGNPRTKTYQRLGNARARVHAALAWTFGMKPEEYAPALEA